MSERSYRVNKIKDLLSELDSLFREKMFLGEFKHLKENDAKYKIIEIEDNFKFITKKLLLLCKTHFEKENLPNLLSEFKEEFESSLEKDNKLFESEYHEGSGEHYSIFTNKIRSYLIGFSEFGSSSQEEILRQKGLIYLEYILNNTPNILSELDEEPNKETDIYDSVKIVLKSVFPDHQDPDFSFQKTAKCYIPDILIPSLNTAIEYKYAKTETELEETIDEILIDVEGYSKHPQYTIFYAVFYLKTNVCSKDRAEEIWNTKSFPDNWKPIFVIGD